MDKRFWAIVGVIVVVFAGIVAVNNNKKSNNTASSAAASNHVRGDLTSKVTLVEYGDFECPVCEGYYPTMQQVQQKYNDTVKFQFRNLPLLQIHPNAFAGARAAEAASKQGKFWEMYDELYNSANWNEWSTSSNAVPYFKAYAKAIKLNETQFEKDFSSSAVNNTVNADLSAFKKTGQEEATPSFFINGKYYANSNFVDSSGTPSVDAFSKVLDSVLKSAK
jgi:protein-disulfide isomerase